MQVVETNQQFMISMPMEAKESIDRITRDNATYWDTLKPFIDSAGEAKDGDILGLIYLNTVYIRGVEKKLKTPIPLKVHISEDGMVDLANTEYKILVSCDTLQEALEEAKIEYDTMYQMSTDTDIPQGESAIAFGKKLAESVWM